MISVNDMDCHRRVSCNREPVILDIAQPFSSFDFIDNNLGGIPSARRLFSLARSFDAQTFVIEDIPSVGLIEDENNEISNLYSDYKSGALKRFSFWRKPFKTVRGLESANKSDFIGYAILKQDLVPSMPGRNEWHIFEAVFPKYNHHHNCVPQKALYCVTVCSKRCYVEGVMYCQQNELNKACAQVALRSLLSRLLPDGDISYRALNEIAAKVRPSFNPADGLSPQQMRAILDECGISYDDIDYEEEEKNNVTIRSDIPFGKYIYGGIESGCGGLLGFSMSGPKADESKHIIPFFGHTFNKDTWVPEANIAYFDIGGGVGYVPSENWTSSFIGHDDNFGPNFCVPRLYVKPDQVQYVVELRHPNVKYGGVIAEAQALLFLYSVTPYLDDKNVWAKRLALYSSQNVQRVILRAVCIRRNIYIEHLKNMKDWQGHHENKAIADALAGFLPDMLWVIEVSLPHLFPANERKVGEIVLNAEKSRNDKKDPASEIDYGLFLLARLPGEYVLLKSINQYGPSFSVIPSDIESHVDLLHT